MYFVFILSGMQGGLPHLTRAPTPPAAGDLLKIGEAAAIAAVTPQTIVGGYSPYATDPGTMTIGSNASASSCSASASSAGDAPRARLASTGLPL